ncbi:MAG: hypothetical protein VW338_00165 [Rhodospirillaceae bacterium]
MAEFLERRMGGEVDWSRAVALADEFAAMRRLGVLVDRRVRDGEPRNRKAGNQP